MTTILDGLIFIGLCELLTAGLMVILRQDVQQATLAYALVKIRRYGVDIRPSAAGGVPARGSGPAATYRIGHVHAPLAHQRRMATQNPVDEEWPALSFWPAPSPKTSAALDHHYQVYERPAVVASVNAPQYAESLRPLSDVSAARRERILASQGGLPAIMWVVLLIGAALIGLVFLFGVERLRSQLAIISGLVIVASLLLFAVYAPDDPFKGGVRIHPDALELVLHQFGSPQGTTRSGVNLSAQPVHLGAIQ